MMDQAHKQRLVGAIVLVALGIIFIPAILDFSEDGPDPQVDSKMPDAPDVMKMEVLPLEVWSEQIDPEIDTRQRIVETPDAVESPDTVAESAAADEKPVAEEPRASSPAPVATEAPPEAPAAPEAVVKKPVVPGGATAWVVQIASFSDESKAFALRDKLRANNHATFIERFKGGSGSIYRVKVGPVLQRSEADQIKQQIASDIKLNGLVMKYQ